MLRSPLALISLTLLSLLLAASLWARPPAQTNPQVFTGEITDSLCAKAGSHDETMVALRGMGRDKKTCATRCALGGARYVLYNAAKQSVYTIGDQERAEGFAGRRVRVFGTLRKNKLTVVTIEAAD